ncbi:MAG: rubredoxin [Spirochaetales bacterium]|nr:rubredoxin [Bullifex sp.]MDD5974025.1 rubredoxin [Spirochaetales bacterium]MDD7271873.1 rubredoxin [Spirochaetales bacterium]MDY4066751.1 rubredoxin [Bullifex sp.]
MKKYRCVLCGFEVEMESLPEDYVCPICGAGPEDFEEVEE